MAKTYFKQGGFFGLDSWDECTIVDDKGIKGEGAGRSKDEAYTRALERYIENKTKVETDKKR